MTWNYRLIFHDLDPDPEKHWYGLHEVYYGKPGEPTAAGLGWTAEPISFTCGADEGPQTIRKMLDDARATLSDARYGTVIKESEWKKHQEPSRPIPAPPP